MGFKPGADESKVIGESLTTTETKTTAIARNTTQRELNAGSSKAVEISRQLSKHGDDFAKLKRLGAEDGNAVRQGLQRRGEIVGMADDAVKLKNPYTIRYSQDNIRQTFKDNTKVSETIARLKNKPSYANEIDPIKLVRYRDLPQSVQETLAKQGVDKFSVFSLDNRRLYAARKANSKVKTKWATREELDEINLDERFSTKTGGKSIVLR